MINRRVYKLNSSVDEWFCVKFTNGTVNDRFLNQLVKVIYQYSSMFHIRLYAVIYVSDLYTH